MDLNLIPVVPNAPDVGECIYCGARNQKLQREHAIPYGLNGPWTLLHASCEECARVTHRFERDTLRCLWPLVRSALNMQTRRRSERFGTLPLVVLRNDVRETIQLPKERYPVYLPTPLFPAPGTVCGRPTRRGVFANFQVQHLAGPSFAEISSEHPGADFLGTHINFSPEDFSRMIAKIALCIGVYALGVGPFTRSPIKPIILGTEDRVGHWVGCWEGEEVVPAKGLHGARVLCAGTDIHVIIRLFAQFGAPEYHVVLGEADAGFVASDRWPWSREP